ncbi:MAG TPA: hydrogenase maturation nickel metallochaperone HypA [Acidimicrobiales bacterium]|nr:hydrogenase maturation nickel metallochaperone HypA [Acidimicrobiales bacterium]
MHDYHAINALVERLTAGPIPGEVLEVRIRAGAGFSAEALAQAYEMLTAGTSLEGSELVVEEQAEQHRCADCGAAWTPAADDVVSHIALCPSCGTLATWVDMKGIEVLAVKYVTGARTNANSPREPTPDR